MNDAQPKFRRPVFVASLLLAGILTQTGCHTFSSSDGLVSEEGYIGPAQGKPMSGSGLPDRNTVTMLAKGRDGAFQRVNLPWKEGMLVTHVLSATKATASYDNPKITLKRATADPYHRIPMHVEYDAKGKVVASGSNYAIHGGDYLVIEEGPDEGLTGTVTRSLLPFTNL